MKVISNGDRNKVYRVKCPNCGAIIQAEAWEFHHFEGMYDEPLVEPNHHCPNCKRFFSMLKWDFEKCYVGDGLYPDDRIADHHCISGVPEIHYQGCYRRCRQGLICLPPIS